MDTRRKQKQGCSQVYDPIRGSGQEEEVNISRVESGRIGSGQEIFKMSRVG